MVNYYYKNENNCLKDNLGEIIVEMRKVIEEVVGYKIYLELSGSSILTQSVWMCCHAQSLLEPGIGIFEEEGGLWTCYGDYHKKVHLQLGGINGRDTLSIRKMTLIEGEKHQEIVDRCDEIYLKYKSC